MVFHWSLRDSKSPQVSRTLLSILSDLNNAVVLIVSICPLISNSSNSLSKPLETVPSSPITIGSTATLMFNSFLSYLTWSKCLSLFSLSLIFTLWSTDMAKSIILQVLFFSFFLFFFSFLFFFFLFFYSILFFSIITWSDLLSEIRRSVCISKS